MSILTPEEIFNDEETMYKVDMETDGAYFRVLGWLNFYKNDFQDFRKETIDFLHRLEDVGHVTVEYTDKLTDNSPQIFFDMLDSVVSDGHWEFSEIHNVDFGQLGFNKSIEKLNDEGTGYFFDTYVDYESFLESGDSGDFIDSLEDYLSTSLEMLFDDAQDSLNISEADMKSIAKEYHATYDTESKEVTLEPFGSISSAWNMLAIGYTF